jgi:murein DD-endopeptidase MepM/ murein hydrolase activator NlpD
MSSNGSITVVAGDTLSKLARKHGTTVSAIQAANGLGGSTNIRVGMKLLIPGLATGGTPPAAPTPVASATAGAFPEIPVDDRSGQFGGLASGPLPKSAVNSIILHRTGGSAAAALRSYADRIKNKSTIGAHYLIDEQGAVILTVPIDRKVSHVGRTRPGFENSNNSHAIGIEHAGAPFAMPVPSGAGDQETLEKNRASIARMDIAPLFRRRILDLSDRELFQLARDNRDGQRWFLYGDLDAPQRRSSFLLASKLLEHFGLGEADLLSHETVSFKSVGEGENIKEYLAARMSYPQRVARLETLAQGAPDLRANADLQKIAAGEKATVESLAGAGGALETAFYDQFWKRGSQLDDLISFLGAGPADPVKLAKKIAAWVK